MGGKPHGFFSYLPSLGSYLVSIRVLLPLTVPSLIHDFNTKLNPWADALWALPNVILTPPIGGST